MRRGDQRGLALVAVLWVVAILALIAAVFMRETRTEIALTRNLEEDAQAEALAEAGVNRAILVLLGLDMGFDPTLPWRVDGTPFALEYGGGTMQVSIQDEGGKIDLNRAGDAVLQGLFISVGVAPEAAQHLADAIADFRDADDLGHVNGAEDTDYARAGLPYDAKDAPFAATEELLEVLGMTPEIYARVAPSITVYSPRRDVNLATAPLAVLKALPYLSPERTQGILTQRTAMMTGTASRPRRFRVIAVTVLVEVTTPAGGQVTREVVLRRSGRGARPFDVVKWRRIWPSDLAG